jgi:hypothetical protein
MARSICRQGARQRASTTTNQPTVTGADSSGALEWSLMVLACAPNIMHVTFSVLLVHRSLSAVARAHHHHLSVSVFKAVSQWDDQWLHETFIVLVLIDPLHHTPGLPLTQRPYPCH